jgi:hypothetical protein
LESLAHPFNNARLIYWEDMAEFLMTFAHLQVLCKRARFSLFDMNAH